MSQKERTGRAGESEGEDAIEGNQEERTQGTEGEKR